MSGELGSAVSAIKETDGPDLTVLGSGVLVQSLREHGLIDEYLLSIYPLVLGSGSRLFPDGAAADLTLTDSVTTTTGVIVGRFRPRG
jgi:dihydrofolate reductase